MDMQQLASALTKRLLVSLAISLPLAVLFAMAHLAFDDLDWVALMIGTILHTSWIVAPVFLVVSAIWALVQLIRWLRDLKSRRNELGKSL